MQTIINQLLARGVIIPNPHTLYIGPEVDLTRIKPGAVIYSGCRILGAQTLVEEGAELGFEAPVTLNNCYVGPKVKLKGGYFEESVFLAGVQTGMGAHVRTGTIMEEQSSTAHTVGLKQTVLFPFVTLGSLINFCDCFMAGGTSRKNHSEVGSSYIHFNYTPSQHKATPSLLGNVPQGVMLNQPPIFLGGQGGMVGPCRFTFGVTTAAGIIVRKNELNPNRLIFGYGDVQRTSACNSKKPQKKSNRALINANIIYIANLVALRHWYRHIRALFVGNLFSAELYAGLCLTLEKNINERILRLKEYALAHMYNGENVDWGDFEAVFAANDDLCDFNDLCGDFKLKLNSLITGDKTYIDTIKSLDEDTADIGSAWLQIIVDNVVARALNSFPG